MSMRRFVAYFLAVSAGSTIAFASTLMGQPAPQESAARESVAEERAGGESQTNLAAADEGLGKPSAEAVRLFEALRHHPRHKTAVKIVAVKIAQVALGK